MKIINYLFLFIFALTLTIPSCKKDETKILTPKEMLTAHPWKFSSWKANGIETLEDCFKDDILTFLTNGTYSITVGAIKCSDDDESNSTTWSLSDAGIFIIDNETVTAVITEYQVVINTMNEVITLLPA